MVELPAFSPELFVSPKEAQQWLLGRVKAWKSHQGRGRDPSAEQVLVLTGERGSGKSWFLRCVAESERHTSSLSLYLDLADQARRDAAAGPEAYARAVNDVLRKRRGAAPGILLLDHVPPQLDDGLRALEDMILRPQLANCGSLLIMALVHPSHVCWRTPALRGGERCALAPFAEPQTRDQVRRLAKAGLLPQAVKPAVVQRYSGGLPLLSYLLATRDRPAAFEQLLRYWLARVPDAERECIQGYLEAVCVLDVLEHAAIRDALAVYQRQRPTAPGYPIHPIGLRNVLQKHWLAQPAPGAPGRIVLHASVRRAVQELLKMQTGDLYAGLERAARSTARERE